MTTRRRFLTTGAALPAVALSPIAVSKQRDLSIPSEVDAEKRELLIRLLALDDALHDMALDVITGLFTIATSSLPNREAIRLLNSGQSISQVRHACNQFNGPRSNWASSIARDADVVRDVLTKGGAS